VTLAEFAYAVYVLSFSISKSQKLFVFSIPFEYTGWRLFQKRVSLRDENLNFNNNHIILKLWISIINISNKTCQCRNTDYWADNTMKHWLLGSVFRCIIRPVMSVSLYHPPSNQCFVVSSAQ
jgi:hypothetical protein